MGGTFTPPHDAIRPHPRCLWQHAYAGRLCPRREGRLPPVGLGVGIPVLLLLLAGIAYAVYYWWGPSEPAPAPYYPPPPPKPQCCVTPLQWAGWKRTLAEFSSPVPQLELGRSGGRTGAKKKAKTKSPKESANCEKISIFFATRISDGQLILDTHLKLVQTKLGS